MYRIYTKETISKEMFNVNLNQEELELVMEGNVFKDHPELNSEDYVVVQRENGFENPTYHKSTNSIEEMTKFEKYNNGLYELQVNEVIYKDDILVLEAGQYIKDNEVVTVPKIEGTRVEWNWETHEWEEKATNLEIVQAQYREYESMDTPSVIEEMKQQDPALATELINMLIELRGLIYTLSASETQSVGYTSIHIPQPSEKLKNFKDRFKKYN